ncbi:hypothetical protein HTY54_28970 [Escherichia coli]|nr:hypothetical protein [Escherichia coli]
MDEVFWFAVGGFFGATTIADGVMNLIAIFPYFAEGEHLPSMQGIAFDEIDHPILNFRKKVFFTRQGRQDIDVLALPDAGASH